MRFYHKLALMALLSGPLTAAAQPQQPYYSEEQDVDDDQSMPPAETAESYGYMGSHPVPYESGQGFCYEQGAHFHEYPPFDQNLFRESGGWFYFVGDPGDFGYRSQMWGYQANHPIPAAYGGGYCFIDWPHRHHYAPPPSLQFNFVNGYYVYGGTWDPGYWRLRPHYSAYYRDYYRRSYYGGIYWRTRPAPIYRPRVTVGAPGVYRRGATVIAPGGGRVQVVGPARPYGGHYGGGPRPYAPGPHVVSPPPAHVGPPPAYGGAPGHVGPPPGHASPAPYGGPPPGHAGPPPGHASPAPYGGPPPGHQGPPPGHAGPPPGHAGPPPGHASPAPYGGPPPGHQGPPPGHQGPPPGHQGPPPGPQGPPPGHAGPPPGHAGPPPGHAGPPPGQAGPHGPGGPHR